jgi:class 3 adenylate cyclase
MNEITYLLTQEGKVIDLVGVVTIGRHASNTVVMDVPKVSRHHCSVVRMPSGFQLVDNQSTNGTYLNGVRLAAPQILKHMDEIKIGPATLRFMSPLDATIATVSGDAPSFEYEKTVTSLDTRSCWMMVADMVDSTSILQEKGVDAFSDVRRAWFRQCHDILKETGGHFNQSTGDGFLALWDHKSEGTVTQLVRAIRALVALQQNTETGFRLVVHTGNVTIGGFLPIGGEPIVGPEVHFAFRLEKIGAVLGEGIIFSQPAATHLRAHLPLVSRGSHALKGFSLPTEVFALAPQNA